jgi:hypothetical protein
MPAYLICIVSPREKEAERLSEALSRRLSVNSSATSAALLSGECGGTSRINYQNIASLAGRRACLRAEALKLTFSYCTTLNQFQRLCSLK